MIQTDGLERQLTNAARAVIFKCSAWRDDFRLAKEREPPAPVIASYDDNFKMVYAKVRTYGDAIFIGKNVERERR